MWNFTEAHYVLLFCLPAVLIADSANSKSRSWSRKTI